MMYQQYRTRLASSLSVALFGLSSLVQAQTVEPGLDLSDAAYPVVITPTRLRQSLADVPASVTIITAETLRRYGITRIEEALRLVPGMVVSQVTGNDVRINYHGTSAVAPRRLNVLIDGVSSYMTAFSKVDWALLPVAVEDIDRIEVIRGPDSSSYGPNSMTAVVNILTKHPKDVERALVSVTVGSHDTSDTTWRMATTLGSTSVRATANLQRNSGYDKTAVNGPGDDDTRLRRFNLRTQSDLSGGGSLELNASYVGGRGSRDVLDLYRSDYFMDGTQFSARWTQALSADHELRVDLSHAGSRLRQRWVSCWPQVAFWPEVGALFQSNPDYLLQMYQSSGDMPTGGSAGDDVLASQIRDRLALEGLAALSNACGLTNQDGAESRTQVELQDTFVVSDSLRLVGGLGWRQQNVDSQTFFGGKVGNRVHWLFGHAEYRPLDWLTANVGGYGESNSLSGSTFSPRVALNVRLTENQTLRAVMSKATRTPDLFEERGNWSYTLTDLSVPVNGETTGRLFTSARAPGGLSSEQIWSRELGYLLSLRGIGLTLDARVFDDRLSRLISKRLSVLDMASSNHDSVRLSGAELQAQWEITSSWSGWLSYGYLLNRDASNIEETAQYSKHSGSLGVSLAWSRDWRTSLAHYVSSGNGVHELRYARTDLTLTHAFTLGGQSGAASLILGYLDTPSVNEYLDATRYSTSTYDQSFSLQGQVRFAF